jgi:hypothetical protein
MPSAGAQQSNGFCSVYHKPNLLSPREDPPAIPAEGHPGQSIDTIVGLCLDGLANHTVREHGIRIERTAACWTFPPGSTLDVELKATPSENKRTTIEHE